MNLFLMRYDNQYLYKQCKFLTINIFRQYVYSINNDNKLKMCTKHYYNTMLLNAIDADPVSNSSNLNNINDKNDHGYQ